MGPGLEKADFPMGPYGVLAFVAVMLRVFRPQNLIHLDVRTSNAGQRVLNALPFGPQFFRIGEMAEVTAAAFAVIGAVRKGTLRGGSVNLHEFPQGVGFHDPRDSQVNPLPPDGPGHEDHGAVQPDDAIALAGIAFHQSGVDLAAFQVFHRSGAYASHFSSSCRSSAAYLARDLLSRPLLRLMNSVSMLPTEARRS